MEHDRRVFGECKLTAGGREVAGSPSNNLIFREAKPEEAGAVTTIVRAAFKNWTTTLQGREPAPMHLDYDLAVGDGEIVAALYQDEIVAITRLLRTDLTLFIDVIAVRPDMQGLGIGSALLSEIESVGDRKGCNVIQLKTVALYFRNVPFYNRNGYSATGCSDFGGIPIYDFEKRIHGSSEGCCMKTRDAPEVTK